MKLCSSSPLVLRSLSYRPCCCQAPAPPGSPSSAVLSRSQRLTTSHNRGGYAGHRKVMEPCMRLCISIRGFERSWSPGNGTSCHRSISWRERHHQSLWAPISELAIRDTASWESRPATVRLATSGHVPHFILAFSPSNCTLVVNCASKHNQIQQICSILLFWPF
jgi:hypothetical protein